MSEGPDGEALDGEVVAALDDVAAAGAEAAEDGRKIASRARRLRSQYMATGRLRPAIERERRPRLVELLSACLARLGGAGSRLRRAQASALRAEGAAPSEIARLFGVSRQRVAAILGAIHATGPNAPVHQAPGSAEPVGTP